mgnify:CR=1 FL=1
MLPGVLQSLLGAGLLGDGNVSDALARAALERGVGEELGEEFDMDEGEKIGPLSRETRAEMRKCTAQPCGW